MNPLFIAHLVADFLLQPNWLVSWKEKHVFGVIVHAAMHAIVMTLFLLPFRPEVFIMILVISLLHGGIDQLKIHYQKKHRLKVAPFGRVNFLSSAPAEPDASRSRRALAEVASLRLGLFEKSFILDQLAHLIALGVAVFIMRAPFHIWWISEAGRGIMWLLLFFSFIFALGNLLKLKKFPAKTAGGRLMRFALLAGVFTAFLIPARLFGASFCSVL